MVSIARSSLTYDWRRYLAAVMSVTFAGLLMLVQLGLLQGLFGSVALAIDKSDAALWLVFPGADSPDVGRTLTRHADAAALIHPEVLRVEPMSYTGGDLRSGDGSAFTVVVNVIDSAPDALAFSSLLTPELRELLNAPDQVLIDVADQAKLMANGSAIVSVNGQRVRIAGAVKGLRSVGAINMLASFETARRIDPTVRRDEPHNVLLAVRPGTDLGRLATDLADRNESPRWEVREAREFSSSSQLYWLFATGMGVGAGFGALLALIVGVVVTSQTLAAAVLASIKELAALRALGASASDLRSVVLELAAWVGAAGLALTAALAALIVWIARSQHVAMTISVPAVVLTVALVFVITVLSALLALRPLYRADPASLLR
jgi:putative ABC transport system permease protein